MVREIMDYISSCDEAVGKALYAEYHRQQRNLELIASENIVSPAVMLAMGTVPTNKYAAVSYTHLGGYCCDQCRGRHETD